MRLCCRFVTLSGLTRKHLMMICFDKICSKMLIRLHNLWFESRKYTMMYYYYLLTSNGIFLEEKHSLEDGKNWAEQKNFKTSNLEREKIEHSCIYYIFGESWWWWWCPWRSQTNYIIVSMKFLKGQDSMYLLHFLDWPF